MQQTEIQLDLPKTVPSPFSIPLPDGELTFVRDLLPRSDADALLQSLLAQVPWRQDRIRIAGKEVPIPRLQAWYGDRGAGYWYSGLRMLPRPWTPELLALRAQIEQFCGCDFNAVLVNRYRDGRDSVGWHSDSETELGTDPVIASYSLGATRRFLLKHKTEARHRLDIPLEHNALLLMAGPLQRHWRHSLPKTALPIGERLNLTFRQIKRLSDS